MDLKSIRIHLGLSQAEMAQKLQFQLEDWRLIEEQQMPLPDTARTRLIHLLIQKDAPADFIESLTQSKPHSSPS